MMMLLSVILSAIPASSARAGRIRILNETNLNGEGAPAKERLPVNPGDTYEYGGHADGMYTGIKVPDLPGTYTVDEDEAALDVNGGVAFAPGPPAARGSKRKRSGGDPPAKRARVAAGPDLSAYGPHRDIPYNQDVPLGTRVFLCSLDANQSFCKTARMHRHAPNIDLDDGEPGYRVVENTAAYVKIMGLNRHGARYRYQLRKRDRMYAQKRDGSQFNAGYWRTADQGNADGDCAPDVRLGTFEPCDACHDCGKQVSFRNHPGHHAFQLYTQALPCTHCY